VVALCAAGWFASIAFTMAALKTVDSGMPFFPGIIMAIGLAITLPPAIICTVIAVFLVGLRRAKLAWTNSPDWPVRKSKRPVIVLRRQLVEKIERDGGRFLVSSCGDTFKLGMKLFGRSKVVGTVRDLGWQI